MRAFVPSLLALCASSSIALAEDDAKRPPWLFIVPEIGSTYTNLKIFYARDLAFQKTDSNGLLLGAQAGLRVPVRDGHGVVLGGFGRVHGVSGYSVRQLGGFAGYSYAPSSRASFMIAMFGSPAWIGSFDTSAFSPQTTASASTLELSGLMLGAHAAGDVYFLPWLGIGTQVGFDVITAQRPAQPVPSAIPPYAASDPLYTKDGVGTGVALSWSIRVVLGLP